jgi:tetratricopeptide (TPR) repeat protein
LELIGEGSFGRVYRAHDPQLDRQVALKIAKPDAHDTRERVNRFLLEARAAAALRHPHIVPVFDADQDGGRYYIASAFIEGPTLAAANEAAPFPYRRAAEVVRLLAAALAYAHEKGFVHRDVKPSNVLVDEQGQPMLADFGLAARQDVAPLPDEGLSVTPQAAGVNGTRGGDVVGTPLYMAPEQALGEPVPASDQYSLGVVLYELLAGQPPFAGTPQLVLFLHRTQPPPRPLRDGRRVPRDLEAICLKAMSKLPAGRYGSCKELADDLGRYLSGEPVRARRLGPLGRTIKWARRRPAQAFGAGTAIAFVVAAIAAVALYAENQRQTAAIANTRAENLQHAEQVRSEISRQLERGRGLEAQGRWGDARAIFAGVTASLKDLGAEAPAGLQQEVEARLAKASSEENERSVRAAEEQRWKNFRSHYEEALFNEAPLAELTPGANRTKAGEQARAALAEYGVDGHTLAVDALETGRRYRGDEQQNELGRDCYQLLLILADIEATTGAGDDRVRCARGLMLLERAAALARTYRIGGQTLAARQAAYKARAAGQPAPASPVWARQPTDPLDGFLAGLEAYRAERYDVAAVVCGAAARLRPGPASFWAQYVRGLALLKLGQWAEAKEALTVCVNLQPSYVWPLLSRGLAGGELGFALKDPSLLTAAEEDLDRALHLSRDDQVRYVALANRGALLARQAAATATCAAVAVGVAVAPAVRQARYTEAAEDLNEAVRINQRAYMPYSSLAVAYEGLGRLDRAVQAVDEAIRRAPRPAALYAQRALLRQRRNEPELALADFGRAAEQELEPERRARCYASLAALHLRAKNYDSTLAYSDEALRTFPWSAEPHELRARALLAKGRRGEAGQALDAYLAAFPSASAWPWKARGLIHMDAREYAEAADAFSRALRLEPGDRAARRERGWAYFLADVPKLAEADFDAVLKDDSSDADALCGRGTSRARTGRWREGSADAAGAERYLAKAVPPPADSEGAEKWRQSQRWTRYELARLYAQVVDRLEADKSLLPREADQEAGRFQRRGLEQLQMVMSLVPSRERLKFWETMVEKNPALAPLRRGSEFRSLAALQLTKP